MFLLFEHLPPTALALTMFKQQNHFSILYFKENEVLVSFSVTNSLPNDFFSLGFQWTSSSAETALKLHV